MKSDSEAFFNAKSTPPSDPSDKEGIVAAKKWAALGKALPAFYEDAAVFWDGAQGEVYIVGVNSWGLSVLKAAY